jgi:hypothetical protein
MNQTRRVVELITGPVTVLHGTGNLASGIIDQTLVETEKAFIIRQNIDISNSQFYQQNYNNNCLPPPIIPPYAGGQSSGAFLLGQLEQCSAKEGLLQEKLAALQYKQIPDSQQFVWPPPRFQQYQPYVPPRPRPIVLQNVGVPIPQLGTCFNIPGFPSNIPLRPNPGNPMTIPEFSKYINEITPGVLPNGQQCDPPVSEQNLS